MGNENLFAPYKFLWRILRITGLGAEIPEHRLQISRGELTIKIGIRILTTCGGATPVGLRIDDRVYIGVIGLRKSACHEVLVDPEVVLRYIAGKDPKKIAFHDEAIESFLVVTVGKPEILLYETVKLPDHIHALAVSRVVVADNGRHGGIHHVGKAHLHLVQQPCGEHHPYRQVAYGLKTVLVGIIDIKGACRRHQDEKEEYRPPVRLRPFERTESSPGKKGAQIIRYNGHAKAESGKRPEETRIATVAECEGDGLKGLYAHIEPAVYYVFIGHLTCFFLLYLAVIPEYLLRKAVEILVFLKELVRVSAVKLDLFI